MEALIELAIAFVSFVFEVTIHALVFVCLLLMSIFSPRYRAKLKQNWNTSGWRKLGLVFGVTLYSAALIFALFVWIPVILGTTSDSEATQQGSATQIEFSKQEMDKIQKTKTIEELVSVAGDLAKQKFAERKADLDQRGSGQRTPAESKQ
jgi:hypothetical protein